MNVRGLLADSIIIKPASSFLLEYKYVRLVN